jgi:hypothetical protein
MTGKRGSNGDGGATVDAAGHLLFIWTPNGYRLEERPGDPPALRDVVDLGDAGRHAVGKLGASPLPGDSRPCAFLIREP